MKDFCEAPVSSERNATISKENDFFGVLIGSWYIDCVDIATDTARKRGWHSSRMLEGMAVQDVIVLPHFEYGTTPRVYNPAIRIREIVYGYTGEIIRLKTRKQEDRIVLPSPEDEHRKWVLIETAESHSHWQDIMVQQDGEWQVNYDLYAKRMK